AAASGSSLAAAADGSVDTVYSAASSPTAGDALTVTLPSARPLDRVAVVGHGQATVQVDLGGTWRAIGRLAASGYTELPAGGATASAIRLLWAAGSPAPTIAEVVPWYADQPAVDLVVSPATAATSVGQPATITAQLTATQPQDERGTLRVSAPVGVSASPTASAVTVYRGGQRSVSVALSAVRPGTYPVTVTLRPARGAAVTQQVTLTVHPQVSAVNVAAAAQGATATASSVEENLPQFTPDHAIDGDPTTRWSSG
ncbi:MAG: hypothetical protein J0H43_03350, partial [Actinobacteria bacterium]|nr:hypothetical protein [Actinomycetota bacterium]